MTNIALSWPALKGVDMTSPAEIERMAQAIAALPNGEARKPLIAEYKAAHSKHVMRLVRRRAEALIAEAKHWRAHPTGGYGRRRNRGR